MFMLTCEKSVADINFKPRELSHELFRILTFKSKLGVNISVFTNIK